MLNLQLGKDYRFYYRSHALRGNAGRDAPASRTAGVVYFECSGLYSPRVRRA
jgi:hypothetical protein